MSGGQYYDSRFAKPAKWLIAHGVHPNHFTFLQLPVLIVQIIAAIEGWRWTFVLLIILLIILDGGDGILARVGNLQTRAGAILDSTFDTLGIAVVMWGAGKFHPELEAWFWVLFIANTVLYLQNALLGEKVIAYIRGPALSAVAFPETTWLALLGGSAIIGFLLLTRLKATWIGLRKDATTMQH